MIDPREPVLPHRAVVRPYMITRGRTTSSLGVFELHAPVVALVGADQLGPATAPESRGIIEICQTPTSVAELSARLAMPVGVVRVLIGDLVDAGMVRVRQVEDRAEHRDVRLLERLLEGIRAL
jgi:Protein of unknown function (DUF742)